MRRAAMARRRLRQPTPELQEAGKRPGSTFAIEFEGLKRDPPL